MAGHLPLWRQLSHCTASAEVRPPHGLPPPCNAAQVHHACRAQSHALMRSFITYFHILSYILSYILHLVTYFHILSLHALMRTFMIPLYNQRLPAGMDAPCTNKPTTPPNHFVLHVLQAAVWTCRRSSWWTVLMQPVASHPSSGLEAHACWDQLKGMTSAGPVHSQALHLFRLCTPSPSFSHVLWAD